MKELEQAREHQFLEKQKLLAEQAKQERGEFLRIINQQKEEREQEAQIDDEKKKILYDHSQQLRSQIQQNEEIKKQERLDYLEEGRLVRQKMAEEKRKLERIKDDKLNELEHLGIVGKHRHSPLVPFCYFR